MEEREENELCHLLMGDLRDERQKAGKQITSQKALVLISEIFSYQCQDKCLLLEFPRECVTSGVEFYSSTSLSGVALRLWGVWRPSMAE